MNTYTVSFFGHRIIEEPLLIEKRLEILIRKLLRGKEYIEFLAGRDGEFDQLVSSVIRRCKREYQSDNNAHVLVLPYSTAEFRNNEDSFWEYYDEIEICETAAVGHFKMPIKLETEKWLTDPIWLCSVFNTKAAVHGRL